MLPLPAGSNMFPSYSLQLALLHFLPPGGHLHSWTHGPFTHLQSPALLPLLPPSLLFPSPLTSCLTLYGDACGYTGPTWTMQDNPPISRSLKANHICKVPIYSLVLKIRGPIFAYHSKKYFFVYVLYAFIHSKETNHSS